MKSKSLPRMNLNKENAIREELSGQNKTLLIFECAKKECTNELRVPPSKIKQYTGYCNHCLRRKRPFGVAYNRLLSNCSIKKITNLLSYEDFLEFTKIKNCTYCNSAIRWIEFTNAENGSVSYNLDRKNSDIGYSKDNCVVCCKICNWSKNELFNHEEFLIIGKAIKKVLKKRNTDE